VGFGSGHRYRTGSRRGGRILSGSIGSHGGLGMNKKHTSKTILEDQRKKHKSRRGAEAPRTDSLEKG